MIASWFTRSMSPLFRSIGLQQFSSMKKANSKATKEVPRVCRLCNANPADKTNSHIIPKFLCKGLFESTSPRHTLSINRKGRARKLQDTPKENHILCSSCEKRIEVIETHFARLFNDVHRYPELPDQFQLKILGVQQYLECVMIHPTLYKLFIYSLVWRPSISSLLDFRLFELPEKVEEELRLFLDANLSLSKLDLMSGVDVAINYIPLYHSCLIKPIEKSESSRGVFTCCNMNETSHLLLLVDFGLFFYTDESAIGGVLERFSNKQNDRVIIALADLPRWMQINQTVIRKMLSKK